MPEGGAVFIPVGLDTKPAKEALSMLKVNFQELAGMAGGVLSQGILSAAGTVTGGMDAMLGQLGRLGGVGGGMGPGQWLQNQQFMQSRNAVDVARQQLGDKAFSQMPMEELKNFIKSVEERIVRPSADAERLVAELKSRVEIGAEKGGLQDQLMQGQRLDFNGFQTAVNTFGNAVFMLLNRLGIAADAPSPPTR